MLLFLTFLLIITTATSPAYAKNELASGTECEERILSLINNAQEYIDVAIYSINRKKILQALIDARQKGVRVRVLLDRKMLMASKENSGIYSMIGAGIEVRVHAHQGLMHAKMAIFDGKSVFSGSFNWTDPAVYSNDEVCNFFVDDPDYAQQHQKYFDELWEKNPESFTNKWLQKQGKCGKHWLLRT